MNIATEVKGYLTAPPPPDITYAPFDIALTLTDGLSRRGHKVDFYAPEGSNINGGRLMTLGQRALVGSQQEYTAALFNTDYHSHNVLALADQKFSAEMFRQATAGNYDVLHFHQPELAFPYVQDNTRVPVVYTQHDPISQEAAQRLRDYQTENQWVVSISDSQRKAAPDLNYAATVYNGVDTELFSYVHDKDDYLLYAARIVPEKGLREAVQVAVETGSNLNILGQRYPDCDVYFEEFVQPYLGDKIRYLGHIARKEAVPYFQKAKALLMPISWEEPFGMTMAEAMSCGTPVIAFERGSVPEVVDDGRTGFIVEDVDGMAEAVSRVNTLDPRACREHTVKNFSVDNMVKGYEKVYQKVAA